MATTQCEAFSILMLYFLSLWCILTYNIHHSRSIATDPKSFLIGWTCVGPSIMSAQKSTTSGNSSIAILITTSTWYKAIISTTCWSPAVSYSTSSTHNSASQSDRWCCPVAWWLIPWLRRSVADVNNNPEGWRKMYRYCVSVRYILHKNVAYSIHHVIPVALFCVCILRSDM